MIVLYFADAHIAIVTLYSILRGRYRLHDGLLWSEECMAKGKKTMAHEVASMVTIWLPGRGLLDARM